MYTQNSQTTTESTDGRIYLFYRLILICIFYTFMPSFSQIESEETFFEEQTDADASELIEYLQFLQQHPLDLNRVTLQSLQSLLFLSPLQAKMMINERSKGGTFRSWDDFQLRMDMDEDLLRLLQQYFTIPERKKTKQKLIELRCRFQIQSPKSSGYHSGKYSGSPVKTYERMTFSFNANTYGSLLFEKDPGENRWQDHFVGFIEKDQFYFLSKIVIGNYRIEVGQGLVFWGPYGFSKSANPAASVKKRATGIRGYTYADENRYLNGIAFETTYQSFSFMGFISSNYLDATLNEDGTISSLPSSGYHRTESEINHKNRLNEKLAGCRIMKSGSWGTVGFTAYQNHYTNEIKKNDLSRYRFYFQGEKNHVMGLDFDIFINQFNFSGEIARSRSQGWALINNGIMKFGKSSLVLSYRRFEPDFQNLHSNGFGVSPACNEEGFYLAIREESLLHSV